MTVAERTRGWNLVASTVRTGLTVERSYTINADAQLVFRALMESAIVARCFAPLESVAIVAQRGGAYQFVDPQFGRVTGRLGEFQPGSRATVRFAQNWPTVLSLDFDQSPEGTTVRVVQTGFGALRLAAQDADAIFAARWDTWMGRMKVFIEDGMLKAAAAKSSKPAAKGKKSAGKPETGSKPTATSKPKSAKSKPSGKGKPAAEGKSTAPPAGKGEPPGPTKAGQGAQHAAMAKRPTRSRPAAKPKSAAKKAGRAI